MNLLLSRFAKTAVCSILAGVLLFLGSGGGFGQDPGPPVVGFIDVFPTVGEADGVVVFTVALSGPSTETITVQYAMVNDTATFPSDYEPISGETTSGTLIFAPGETVKQIKVKIINDAVAEDAESFTIVLSNPVNTVLGSQPAVVTITDDDGPLPTVQFASANYSVSESAGTAVIEVTLSAEPLQTVTVKYAVTGGTATSGTDYSVIGNTLTFAAKTVMTPGEMSKTITVAIVNDPEIEDDETVEFTLSAPSIGGTLGAQSTAVLSIIAQEKPTATVVMVTKKATLLDQLSSGKYGYTFETQVKTKITAVPPRGKVVQRFKSSSFGINPKQKTDSAKKYVFDNVDIEYGGLLQVLKGLPLDTNGRYVSDPNQQAWILRYAKVEGEGGFFLYQGAKPPKDMPKNGKDSPLLADYNSWGKYFNAPDKYARWTIEYEYLYIDAALAKKANLDQDAILALITDDGVKKRVKTILKDAKKTLGTDSTAILYTDFTWPDGLPVGILSADFKKKK